MTPTALPIDSHLARIAAAVDRHRVVVLVAPPGSGKTTRVAPALGPRGPLILLEPRRVVTRALSARIANEQGVTLGEEVGYQIRNDRRFGAKTRLLVVTEGVLNRRLRADPLLSKFNTVVLDEFHERSVHADLAICFLKQALNARDDLRVVVMSATLDAGPLAAYLPDVEVIEVAGRPHPVEIRHEALSPDAAVRAAMKDRSGHVLVFLAGRGEIRRTSSMLAGRLPECVVHELHGGLSAVEQDRALAPSSRRKVILATNIAETSLTVEGVTTVIDSGFHKVLRYDRARGLDRLEQERVPLDSAIQRSGRAGRTGPGLALRLWDQRVRLDERREPELLRIDLAAPLLEVIAWGGDALNFDWFEAPEPRRIAEALDLLSRLALVRDGRLTPLGEAASRLPLHPRLATVLLAAGATTEAASAVAILAERDRPDMTTPDTTDCDLLSGIDAIGRGPESIRKLARELESDARPLVRELGSSRRPLRQALLLGFPDRVAARREAGSPRLLLYNGHGAVLSRRSGVREGEFVLALDLEPGDRGPLSEAEVHVASRIEREWLQGDDLRLVHAFDSDRGAVRARELELYGAITIRERPATPEPIASAPLLVAELVRRGFGDAGESLLRRLAFAGVVTDRADFAARVVAGRTSLHSLDLFATLDREERRRLDACAPVSLRVPSGRERPLDYRADGSVVLAVKLQELFGLADSPRIGEGREPVVLELLAPNGRPVQTTRDLRSFWDRMYPEVRKELRPRYPRHPWPDDPWTATPTAKTVRKR